MVFVTELEAALPYRADGQTRCDPPSTSSDGGIDTRIVSSGTIALDPPGITLDINEIYER